MTEVKQEKESMPIQVRFRRGIRPDGELEVVTIQQVGQEIRLSEKQAISLARTITAKYGQ